MQSEVEQGLKSWNPSTMVKDTCQLRPMLHRQQTVTIVSEFKLQHSLALLHYSVYSYCFVRSLLLTMPFKPPRLWPRLPALHPPQCLSNRWPPKHDTDASTACARGPILTVLCEWTVIGRSSTTAGNP